VSVIRTLIVILAIAQGAWLVFDGSRALVVGDYVTRSSGPRAGQLGPWSILVSSVGLAPRGSAMKIIHVVLGVAWLAAAFAFLRRVRGSRLYVFAAATGTFWYVPVGTVVSLIAIALLFTTRSRST
jgi:hypothetical protein